MKMPYRDQQLVKACMTLHKRVPYQDRLLELFSNARYFVDTLPLAPLDVGFEKDGRH